MTRINDAKPQLEASFWSREFEPEGNKPAEKNRVTVQELYEALASMKPVRIRWAILPEEVNLSHGQIPRELRIENCEVRGSFSFENVVFAESLVLSGTVFRRGLRLNGSDIKGSLQMDGVRCERLKEKQGGVIPAKAELKATTVKGRWTLNNAVFSDGFDVEYASFQGPVSLQSATFAGEQANFAFSTCHQVVHFEGSRFSEGATFVSADFRSHLLFTNVRSSGEMIFLLCRVAGSVTIGQCWFRQDVTLSNAVIDGFLVVNRNTFHGCFNCSSLTAGDVLVEECRFAKDLSFKHASAQSLIIHHSVFLSNAKCWMSSVCVKGELSMYTCRFGTDLHLSAAKLGGLKLGTIKDSTDPFADFHGADTIIYGNTDVSDTRIDGRFACMRVLFLGAATFVQMKVDAASDVALCRFGVGKGDGESDLLSSMKPWKKTKLQAALIKHQEAEVVFDRSEFGGRVGFLSIFHRPAWFHGIVCRGPIRFLARMSNSSQRSLEHCVFDNLADFYFARFLDEANFGGAEFRRNASLRNAQFSRALKFELLSPRCRTRFDSESRLEMQECTYDSLQEFPQWECDTGQPMESHLASFLKHTDGSRSSFIFLEHYYRRIGDPKLADSVRQFWREREGRDKKGLARFWDHLIRWTTRYGTNFVPIVTFLVLLGLLNVFAQIFSDVLDFRDPHRFRAAILAAKTVRLVVGALLAVGVAVVGDVFRRTLWPEKG